MSSIIALILYYHHRSPYCSSLLFRTTIKAITGGNIVLRGSERVCDRLPEEKRITYIQGNRKWLQLRSLVDVEIVAI